MTRAASAPFSDTHSHPRRRLPRGGLIDRSTPLPFTFDGRSYLGFAGDTLASALIANTSGLVGRSLQVSPAARHFHCRARGAQRARRIARRRRREPNTRATAVECSTARRGEPEPLAVARFRRDGGQRLAFALFPGRVLLQDLHVAAEYSGRDLRTCDPPRRRSRARSAGDDPDEYEKAFAHCDVLVIGSGPAGLMAAVTAAHAGARVILAEEDFRLGRASPAERHDRRRTRWRKLGRASRGRARVSCLKSASCARTSVFGVYDRGQYGAVERVSDHCRAAAASAAPAFLEDRRPARGAGRGRERTADCLCRQRSSGRHARGCGAHLPQPLCRRAGVTAGRVHQQ